METLTEVHVLQYYELDELVNTTFDRDDFESVAEFEWRNDTSSGPWQVSLAPRGKPYEGFSAAEARETTTYLRKKNRKPVYGVGPFQTIGALCYAGALPWGTYIIQISW